MNIYAITWQPCSPLITPLQSDTIFGHICWAYKYLYGEEKFDNFFAEFKQKQNFVCSSAFKYNYIPIPNLPLTPKDKECAEKLQEIIPAKEMKKKRLLAWQTWCQEFKKYSYGKVLDDAKNKADILIENAEKRQSVLHASINRLTGTTAEGGNLYSVNESIYHGDEKFWSFLKCDLDKNILEEIFAFIQNNGYGKDKNTGKGWFKITVEAFDLPTMDNTPNAWLNLSEMVPNKDDTLSAYYELNTKYGKLGGDYAVSDSPFKYPLLQIKPGAVFLGENSPQGSIVENIHPDKNEIVQNCLAFCLPFGWEGA